MGFLLEQGGSAQEELRIKPINSVSKHCPFIDTDHNVFRQKYQWLFTTIVEDFQGPFLNVNTGIENSWQLSQWNLTNWIAQGEEKKISPL